MQQNLPSDFSGTKQVNDDQQDSPQIGVGGVAKEQKESGPVADMAERVPVVETREPEKIPEEVEGWLTKLEKGEDIKLPQPVQHQGQTVVEPAEKFVNEDQIVLPMDEESLKKGLHMKAIDSARWLAEWCVKIVKKFGTAVVYRNN